MTGYDGQLWSEPQSKEMATQVTWRIYKARNFTFLMKSFEVHDHCTTKETQKLPQLIISNAELSDKLEITVIGLL